MKRANSCLPFRAVLQVQAEGKEQAPPLAHLMAGFLEGIDSSRALLEISFVLRLDSDSPLPWWEGRSTS